MKTEKILQSLTSEQKNEIENKFIEFLQENKEYYPPVYYLKDSKSKITKI